MKQILRLLLFLLPCLIFTFFKLDYSFYNSIKLPFFAPPIIVLKIAYPIICFLIACSIIIASKVYNYNELPKEYKQALFMNYICIISFPVVFFLLKNLFLGFINSLLIFINSIYFYTESRNLSEKSAHFITPYIIWALFITFLFLTIYILNI